MNFTLNLKSKNPRIKIPIKVSKVLLPQIGSKEYDVGNTVVPNLL